MKGERLAQIARWIFREETRRLMIEPAIADLQAEASRGAVHRASHYLGLCIVWIRAFLEDLALDFSFAFDSESRRIAWKRAAFWYVGASIFFATLLLNRIDSGLWPQALTSAILAGLVAGTLPATICVIVYLYRRRESRRSIACIGILLSLLTVGIALLVRPMRISADQVIARAVQAAAAQNSAVDHRPYLPEDLDPGIARWKDILIGVQLLAWVPIGVILGRRRGIRIAITMVGIFLTWSLSVWVLVRFGAPPTPSYLHQRWREIALNVFVAVVWLIFDAARNRLRAREAA
jgi:hypothetical protein